MPSAIDPAEWLDAARVRGPERLFIRTGAGTVMTYGQAHARMQRFASALRARGVVTGDRVAVQVDKSVDAVLLYLACLASGAVFVPINVANTQHEVDYFWRDAEPRVAVIRPGDRAMLESVAAAAQVGYLETLGEDGTGSLAALADSMADAPVPTRDGGAAALAAIVYTSGTTGRAKGAMLTRGNLASNAVTLADAWQFRDDDVLLHTLPLFHVHGLFAAINTTLAASASMVLLAKFEAAAVLAELPHATVYMGVPTHYTRLLQEPGLDRCTARMRLFVSGSAPLLAETHHEFARRTGHHILERYGMTETLMNTSNPYRGARVPGSVGPPLPGISVRVAGDEVGALEVRGPNVFSGYWRAPDKTRAEFTADGWFRTGDVGRIDAQGYVYIVGRAKDVVITGGYNVYPKEVECELDTVPGVLESAVFGVPHADFGEGVTAAVVCKPGAELSEALVLGAIKGRLAGYKIPKRVLFVAELPRNAMGKVQKNALRSAHSALYQDPRGATIRS